MFSANVLFTFDIYATFYVYNNLIYVYNTDSGLIEYQSDYRSRVVYSSHVSVAVRQDDLIIFADLSTYKILEFSFSTGNTIQYLGSGHSTYVNVIYLDGNWLITGGLDYQMILWDVRNKTENEVLGCNDGTMYQFTFFNSSSVYVGDKFGSVALCDYVNNRLLKKVSGKLNALNSLVVYQDSINSGGISVRLIHWSISSQKNLESLPNNTNTGYDLFVISNYLLSCVDSIKLRDLNTFTIVKNFAAQEVFCIPHFYYFNGFVFAPYESDGYTVNKYSLNETRLVLVFYSHITIVL